MLHSAGFVVIDSSGRIKTVVTPVDAGSLSGTTLSATVVTSSLTTVGSIASGAWHGTTIAADHGGTGIANAAASTITLGGALTLSGAFTTTLTVTGNTAVTLPTTGTLVNTAVTTLSSLASIGTITTGVWNAGAVTSSGIITAGDGSYFKAVTSATAYPTVGYNSSGILTIGTTKLVTVLNDGTVALNSTQTHGGFLFVQSVEVGGAGSFGECALLICGNGISPVVYIGWDPGSVYTTTVNTANKVNVYAAGSPAFTLQNKRGATRYYYFTWLGYTG